MKNKFLAILLSAVVAFGLWIYVITVVSPESEKTYYEIPVVLQNKEILAERGLMIVSDTPTVTLSLKSDRTILNDLNEANINVITNVANIEKPGTHSLTYTIAYPGNIPDNSVSVQSSSTDLIVLDVENRIRKTVPVVLDFGESSVPADYIADIKNPVLDYTSVEISGPESVVNQITQAVIRVDLKDQTKTIVRETQYALCNEAGEPVDAEKITTNVGKINLSVKIQRVKEITLNIEKIYGGGAAETNSTVKQDLTTIRVAGSEALLEKLDALTVGTVDLSKLMENTTLFFDINLPEGVTNLTGVDRVEVEVSFDNLMVKTFEITDFRTANVPEGLEAVLITQRKEVTLRGPADQIQSLTASDIWMEADFSGEQAGTVTVNGRVIIEKYPGIGAVGTYEVSATLQAALQPPVPNP